MVYEAKPNFLGLTSLILLFEVSDRRTDRQKYTQMHGYGIPSVLLQKRLKRNRSQRKQLLKKFS